MNITTLVIRGKSTLKLIKEILTKYSNWKVIVPAFIACVLCIYLFQNYQSQMISLAGGKVLMIDMRPSYDLEEINTFFTQIFWPLSLWY